MEAHCILVFHSGNAAEDAQLESIVGRLKDGWSASVGPRGRLLSGGERQRVCLARALYREEQGAGILLMDEATSSLDARTENLVTQAIMKRVQLGATAIIVAHRLTSVQGCDLILVMKDGQIVESGTHDELCRSSGGWYAEAWRLQSQVNQFVDTASAPPPHSNPTSNYSSLSSSSQFPPTTSNNSR